MNPRENEIVMSVEKPRTNGREAVARWHRGFCFGGEHCGRKFEVSGIGFESE